MGGTWVRPTRVGASWSANIPWPVAPGPRAAHARTRPTAARSGSPGPRRRRPPPAAAVPRHVPRPRSRPVRTQAPGSVQICRKGDQEPCVPSQNPRNHAVPFVSSRHEESFVADLDIHAAFDTWSAPSTQGPHPSSTSTQPAPNQHPPSGHLSTRLSLPTGTFCAAGDLFLRPGTSHAYGCGISVPERVECPRPFEDHPAAQTAPARSRRPESFRVWWRWWCEVRIAVVGPKEVLAGAVRAGREDGCRRLWPTWCGPGARPVGPPGSRGPSRGCAHLGEAVPGPNRGTSPAPPPAGKPCRSCHHTERLTPTR